MKTALKTRCRDALEPHVRPAPPWKELERVLREDARLSGDGAGFSADVMMAAVAALSSCQTVGDIARLPLRFQRALITGVWLDEYDLYQSALLIGHVANLLGTVPPKSSDLKRIARGLLFAWRPDLPAFRTIAEAMDGKAVHGGASLAVMQGWGAFKPNGPAFLASVALRDDSRSIEQCLGTCGLTHAQQRAGFARETFRKICAEVADSGKPKVYGRLLDFAADGEELRFPGDHDRLAHACLKPWRTNDPEPALKERLLGFLHDTLGDPRFEPAGWVQVNEADKAVMLRWLAGKSLQLFLDVVGDTAEEHMWRFRRAFWEACFNRGIIDDAWVVFGPDALSSLRRRQQSGDASQNLLHGSLTGAQGSQSVLLMKIGECTLVEWSHSGKIWMLDPEPGRQAPKLHRRGAYAATECRGFKSWARFETSHAASGYWTWQSKVAEQLAAMTGVRITPGEAKP